MDIVTTSDIAYVISLLQNSKEVWEQDIKISLMASEEQQKYKDGYAGYEVEKPQFSCGTNTKMT